MFVRIVVSAVIGKAGHRRALVVMILGQTSALHLLGRKQISKEREVPLWSEV